LICGLDMVALLEEEEHAINKLKYEFHYMQVIQVEDGDWGCRGNE